MYNTRRSSAWLLLGPAFLYPTTSRISCRPSVYRLVLFAVSVTTCIIRTYSSDGYYWLTVPPVVYLSDHFLLTTAGDAEDIGQLPQQEDATHSRAESRRNQPAMVNTHTSLLLVSFPINLITYGRIRQDRVVHMANAAGGNGQAGQSQTGRRRNLPDANSRRCQSRPPEQTSIGQKGIASLFSIISMMLYRNTEERLQKLN